MFSCDKNSEKSLKTKDKLIKLCKLENINVVNDIDKACIVFSIGGDGTFLKSSKLSNKPLICFNTGTLGYLTGINPDNLGITLKSMINNGYYIENRMMLEGEVIKENGEVIYIPTALNEIAISKNTFGDC